MPFSMALPDLPQAKWVQFLSHLIGEHFLRFQGLRLGCHKLCSLVQLLLVLWIMVTGFLTQVQLTMSLMMLDSAFLPGGEQILMGNGQGLPIHSIGSGSLKSPYKPHTSLALNDLLLFPTITK